MMKHLYGSLKWMHRGDSITTFSKLWKKNVALQTVAILVTGEPMSG